MGLRDALENAYDDIENAPADAEAVNDGAAPAPDTVASPPSDATEPARSTTEAEEAPKADRPRDEEGKFAKAVKAAADKAEKAAAAPKVAPQTAPQAVPPVQAQTPPVQALKAPQSWKPAVREKFATLPPEVQQEVLRREQETTRALQQAAETAKGAQPFQELLRPYESAIRAQGVEPRQYLSNVLQSAHVIFNGPPQVRAQALADVIMQAGIPPELLDQALVARMGGQPGQVPQAQPQFQQAQFRDPRLDQLLAQAEQRKAEQAQAAIAESQQLAQEFASDPQNEFFEDVRDSVADILDVWAQQGKTDLTKDDLKRAYSLAVQMNPDLAPVLEQRRAAEAAQKAMASTARSRTAASSVRSQPTSAPSAAPKGLRETLEAKFEELNG